MDKRLSFILFVSLFILISLLYGYQKILFMRPQSIHSWRQADCASMATMYYQTGMHFFQPKTHNLTSHNSTSCNSATSEIPILYYLVAVLYRIFGYHEFFFRLINISIFFFGLFCLFKCINLITGKAIIACFASLLFFTSPVQVYYANNYLSNIGALSFSIAGWYLFFSFRNNNKSALLYWVLFFFSLACSMKITAGFSLLTLLGLFLFEKTGLIELDHASERVFPKGWGIWTGFLVALIIPLSWIIYAKYYNHLHESAYFSTQLNPIWTCSKNEIHRVLLSIKHNWQKEYFNISVLYLMGFLLILQLIFMKKSNRLIMLVISLVFAEILFYVMAQFQTFEQHDYYTIDIFILLVLILIGSMYWIKEMFPGFFSNKIVLILLGLFLGYNVIYAQNKLRDRYYKTEGYSEYIDFYTVTPYLRQICIHPLDTVICLPDKSHLTLYLMNQHGWSSYLPFLNQSDDSSSIAYMNKFIDRGARYLILKDREMADTIKFLHHFTGNLIGQYNHIGIYDLKDTTSRKFNAYKNPTVFETLCDAEKFDTARNVFYGQPGNIELSDCFKRSDEKAFKGKYSIRLDMDQPFGPSIILKNVCSYDEIYVSVHRFGSQGLIIAADQKESEFCYTRNNVFPDKISGWDSLTMYFKMPGYLNNHDINIYPCNNSNNIVYFDNLKVSRRKSPPNRKYLTPL